MTVQILISAQRDLLHGYRFYEKQDEGLGEYFLDSLFSDIDSLAFFSGIHSKQFAYYRMLSKRCPFAIYYKIEGKSVFVYAVLDCRRNPNWIQNKLK